jgi:protein-tyrosine phosphatase
LVVLSNLDRHREQRGTQHTANVLFVCTGNICRSPIAEGVFRALVANAGLTERILVDSAATHDYQLGEPPDRRAIAHARRRGYDLPARCARRVDGDDFRRFEWILAMDMDNLRVLHELRPGDYTGYLGLLLDFTPGLGALEVPDPYYGAPEDFEQVLDLVERGSAALLDTIRATIVAPESIPKVP